MAGSYLKSLQLAKQIEQKAKEASKKKADAEARLQVAEGILERCKKLNADIDLGKKAIAETNAALESKDFDLALDKSERAVETSKKIFKERILSILKGADEIVQIVTESGDEASQLKQLIADVKSSMDKDDFDETIKLAEETYDLSQKALHEHYAKTYSKAQQIILKAKDIGENVEDFQRELRDTKEMIESEDYRAAIATVNSLLASATDIVKSRIKADIDSAEDSVLAAEDLGTDVSKLREYIDKARESLESMEFEEAASYVRRAQSECEKATSSKILEDIRKLREDIRIVKRHEGDAEAAQALIEAASKAMRDKNIAEATKSIEKARSALKDAQFKIVLQAISKSKDNFVLAKKLNLDIGKPITTLNEARDKLQKGLFEEAIAAAEQADKEVTEILSAFRNAQSGLEKLAMMIKQAEDAGIEIPSDVNMFGQVRTALANKDFVQADAKAKSGIEAIEKHVRKAAQEKILDAESLISIAGQLGIDPTEAKEQLRIANEEISELNSLEAFRRAVMSIEASNKAYHEVLTDTASALESFLDDCSKSFDVTEFRSSLNDAKQLIYSSQYIDALSRITDIKENLEKRGIDEAKRLIGDAEIKISEVEAAGVDASDLRLMVKKADEALQKGVLEVAVATAKETIQDADEALEEVAQKALFSLKAVLDSAKSNSMDTTKWRAYYKQAKELLEAGEYSSSYQTSSKSLSEINRFTQEQQILLGKLSRCEELLSEAAKNNIDVSAAAKLLEESKSDLASLSIDDAERKIAEAENILEKLMGMYLAAKLIMSLKVSLGFTDSENLTPEGVRQSLEEAKAAMKERNYDLALASAKKARAELDELLKSKSEEEIASIATLIADAKNVGVDTSRPEKLLEQARNEFEQQEYESCLKSAKSAREEIDQIRDLSSKSAFEIRIAKERIRDAEMIGIDMSEPRAILAQAVDSLNSHKYAIAFELARKISNEASEIAKKNLQGLLQKLARRITYAEKDGTYVDDARSLLDEAKSSFEVANFQEAVKKIISCEQELERADLQRSLAMGALGVAKEKISSAEKDMLAVAAAKEIYEKAEEAMREKKFESAIELSISVGDEIERIRRQAEGCRLDMNSLTDRLSRLRKIGLELAEIEKIRQKAEEALQNGAFTECREYCIDGERLISVELEKIINEKLSKAEILLDLASSLGLPDDNDYRAMLDAAQVSAREGLWDVAFEETQKTSQSVESYLKEKLYSAISDIRAKSSVVAKSGASVAIVEQELKKIEKMMEEGEYELSFKSIIESESLLSKIESLHKDYLDAKYAAESAVTVAKRFGIPTRESDRLIAMAEIERESDYSSAIELLKDARENIQASMDRFNPDVSVSLLPVELKQDQRAMIDIELANKGKALAKDLKLEFFGSNMDVESVPEVAPLKAGETRRISVPVVPRRIGDAQISVTVTAKRIFDGKEYQFSAKSDVIVLPKEPTARIARATEPAKCASCSGKIKPGFDIAICNKCNSIAHLACAKRTRKCGNCGATLEF
ncbi:MAG: hypothetical protein QW505_02770 [Thermoplasmata archaeon]